MNHNQLTGRFAVHPFAFVQATDPAANPVNAVTAGKAWIDTSIGNTLKVRDPTNAFWITVLGGDGAVGIALVEIDEVYVEAVAVDMLMPDLVEVDYV